MNKICEQVRDLLAHDRGNLNFSPSTHYAVQKRKKAVRNYIETTAKNAVSGFYGRMNNGRRR